MYSERPCKQKTLIYLGEKGAKFSWVPPIISGTSKATNFQFCTHILSIDRNKRPLQISGKSSRGLVRILEIFRGTHVLGASRGRLCDSSAVLSFLTLIFCPMHNTPTVYTYLNITRCELCPILSSLFVCKFGRITRTVFSKSGGTYPKSLRGSASVHTWLQSRDLGMSRKGQLLDHVHVYCTATDSAKSAQSKLSCWHVRFTN